MSRKRKNLASRKQEWKPVAIECEDGLTAEDFEGLVAFEELSDYQIVKGSDQSKLIPNDKNNEIKKSKKKKKKILNKFDVQENLDDNDNERINEENVDMSKWEELSVPELILKSLRDSKIYEPTAIQKSTIRDAIVDRLNIYGAAPTGSGKTLAFAIPIVAHIINDKNAVEKQQQESLKAIILTPTRELAVQIKKHAENICKYTDVKLALVVGGLAIQKQERVLQRKKPDIVVATPGRLWEIVTNGSVPYLNRNSLLDIKYLIIDEADRMVEKAHFEELRFIIDFLNEHSQVNCRQVFIFSATLTMDQERKKHKNQKKQSENLIKLLKLDPNDLKICDLTDGGQKSKPSGDQLTESIIHCLKEDKDVYLYYFVCHNPGRTIVFCNSIDCIRRLLNIFRFLRLNPLALHSSMPQKRRLTNVERFTTAQNCLLFATDVAARGLDIPNINHVVHYQVPRTADTYVHRSGRTARLQNKGLSLILCDPKEETFFLRDFSRIIQKDSLTEMLTNSRILKQLKERVKLAQQCDSLEHKLRKDRSEENWFQTTAKACDLIVDTENDDDIDGENLNANIKERKDCQKKLKIYEKQLKILLKRPISCPNRK